MGGETRPKEARLQRRAHPKGRNGMKHPATRGCARRDGPQAEAPATPADEGRPTNRRRRVTRRGDHKCAMRSSPKAETREARLWGARGRQSGLERGRGRRSRDAPRRQGANKNAPLQAEGQRGGVRAGLWASRRRATAAQECSRGQKDARPLAAAQRGQSALIRSRVPCASPPSARRRSTSPLRKIRFRLSGP